MLQIFCPNTYDHEETFLEWQPSQRLVSLSSSRTDVIDSKQAEKATVCCRSPEMNPLHVIPPWRKICLIRKEFAGEPVMSIGA